MGVVLPFQCKSFVHRILHDEHGNLWIRDIDDWDPNEVPVEFESEHLERSGDNLGLRQDEESIADSIEETDQDVKLNDGELIGRQGNEKDGEEIEELVGIAMTKEKIMFVIIVAILANELDEKQEKKDLQIAQSIVREGGIVEKEEWKKEAIEEK